VDEIKAIFLFLVSIVIWIIVFDMSGQIYNNLENVLSNNFAITTVILINTITTIHSIGRFIQIVSSFTEEI